MMRNKRLWLGLLALGAVFAGALAYFAWPRPIPGPPPLPSPNGYDDFLQAADSIVEKPDFDARKASGAELREFVAANGRALEQLRIGLGRACGVPLEFSQEHLAVSGERVQKMRELGRLLAAEGRLAEQEGHIADAARSYLDAIRLGQAMCRGGLILDRTVGNVLEGGYGIAALNSLRARLDVAGCQKLIAELEVLDRSRESFADCAAREHKFQDVLIDEMGLGGRWNRARLKKLAQPPEVQARQRYVAVQTELRLLMVELAIQCHVAEAGSTPESLDALVPRYLSAVPRDPAADRPFEYHRDADGLYGVGPKAAEGEAAKSEAP